MAGGGVFDAVVCCGVLVTLAEPVTIPLLRRLRAMDVPGLRSSHSVPTPRGGGIPIAVGLLVAVAFIRGGASAAFAFAVGFFALLGFVDDLRGLSAARRLALQGAGSAGVAVLLITPMHLAIGATVALILAAAMLAALAVLRGLPVEAVVGPLALYLADTAWTLQRRIRARERWLQAHRTHVYQRWCDAGWSHQEVTLLTGAITVLLTALGAASLSGDLRLRAAADVTGIVILGVYLISPVLFRRLGLHEDVEPRRFGDGSQPSVPGWVPRPQGRSS